MKKITRVLFMNSMKEAQCFEGSLISVFLVEKTIDKRIVCAVVRHKKAGAVYRNKVKRVLRQFFYSLPYSKYCFIVIAKMIDIFHFKEVNSEIFSEDFNDLSIFIKETLGNKYL